LGGIKIVHVPYRGGAAAYPDVIAGRVELQIDPLHSSMQNIESKQVKAIAVTSPQRAATAPNIPTVGETLADFTVMSISGLVVPSGTPRDIVHKISADVGKALQSSELKARMAAVGMEPEPVSPEAFDKFIRDEIAKWAEVVRASGMKI